MLAGTKAFDAADQERFARLSGDYNPMHMDAVAARRTQAGEPVVHGVHAVLWALETLAAKGVELEKLTNIDVQFRKFIYLGRPVALQLRVGNGGTGANLDVDGLLAASLDLRFGPRKPGTVASDFGNALLVGAANNQPSAPELGQLTGFRGWIAQGLGAKEAESEFPRCSAAFGAQRVIGLALLSNLVGMICPGLHSIFTGFSVDFVIDSSPRAGIGFGVKAFREALRALRMDVAGCGIEGKVSASIRWPPVNASSVVELAGHVSPSEFARTSALVVGGSRGLGAWTAKLLATGGARVVATYSKGRADAEVLSREINDSGVGGTCAIMPLDVSADLTPQLEPLRVSVNQLYYFATPLIFRPKQEVFSRELFGKFYRFYVESFYEACKNLLLATSSLAAFYPSSIFVTSRPDGMTEYSMAKAAGEILCADLPQSMPGLHVMMRRLPRVLTDQTATVARAENADPLSVVLPLIRELHQI